MPRLLGGLLGLSLLCLVSACSDTPTLPERASSPDLASSMQSSQTPLLSEPFAIGTNGFTTQAWADCAPAWWATSCSTGTVPARRDLQSVWFGIDSHDSITEYEVWDTDTKVRIRWGSVGRNTNFRDGIYGLVGNHYQLRLTFAYNTPYGFICDYC